MGKINDVRRVSRKSYAFLQSRFLPRISLKRRPIYQNMYYGAECDIFLVLNAEAPDEPPNMSRPLMC